VLVPIIRWEKNGVTGSVEGRNNATGETEGIRITAEDVEVYWPDVLKCWPDRTGAKHEQLKPQRDRALIKPQRDRALVWLNESYSKRAWLNIGNKTLLDKLKDASIKISPRTLEGLRADEKNRATAKPRRRKKKKSAKLKLGGKKSATRKPR
jgi:hypothetical protein